MTTQITLQLDLTTDTTGNAEQVARMIGVSAWRISGDYLIVEDPLLDYRVTDNETYSGKLYRIPNGAIVELYEGEQLQTADESLEQKLKEQSAAPRVTLDHINELMRRVTYVTVQQPGDTTSTFVHAYLDGKFFLASGFSGCISAENFDADIGERLARSNAEKRAENKLWELEGYMLYRNTAVIDISVTAQQEFLAVDHSENTHESTQYHQSTDKPWMAIPTHKIIPFINPRTWEFKYYPAAETTLDYWQCIIGGCGKDKDIDVISNSTDVHTSLASALEKVKELAWKNGWLDS